MNTENLSTLKIHKLTKAQYERELAAGNIDPNALYLTPDEGQEAYDVSAVQYGKRQELTAGQKAQARFNIGAAELNDIYKGSLKEYHYTWDGVTEGRDTFTMTMTVDQSPYKTYHFCKVSNDILERSLARQFNGALIMYNDGDTEYCDPRYDLLDNPDAAWPSSCAEYDNYYMITGSDFLFHSDSIIFAEAAGPYTCSYDPNDIVVTFTVPSSGVYFPFNPDENKYISDFTLSTFDKREIYLGNATVSVNESNDPLAKFNNDGALETFFEDGRRYSMATTNFVEDYADYLLDTVNLLIDNIPKMVTITQEDYDKLVANGTIDPDMYYVIVSGSA